MPIRVRWNKRSDRHNLIAFVCFTLARHLQKEEKIKYIRFGYEFMGGNVEPVDIYFGRSVPNALSYAFTLGPSSAIEKETPQSSMCIYVYDCIIANDVGACFGDFLKTFSSQPYTRTLIYYLLFVRKSKLILI